jgi:hypothetical protein
VEQLEKILFRRAQQLSKSCDVRPLVPRKSQTMEALLLAHLCRRKQHLKPALKTRAMKGCLRLLTQHPRRIDRNGRERRKRHITKLRVNGSSVISRKHKAVRTQPLTLLPTCRAQARPVAGKSVISTKHPEMTALRLDPLTFQDSLAYHTLLKISMLDRMMPVATISRMELNPQIRC